MPKTEDKTQALVLATIPFNDRTQFVHLYTEAQGRVTCKVPIAARGRKANHQRSMLSPMTVLDLVLGGRPQDEVRSLIEAEVVRSPYLLTLTHPDKAAQCLYMAEFLAHTVREHEPNRRLWQYITYCLELLEHCDEGWANFHLLFTNGMIDLLGFSVNTDDYCPGCCFDMVEGTFTRQPIAHPYYLNATSAEWFCKLLDTTFSEMHKLVLNRQQRASLLDIQLAFIAQQIPEMGQLRSVEVLRTLFD